MVEQKYADLIKLDGASQPLVIKWTAGVTRTEWESKRVQLTISARDSSEQFLLKNVHTVEQMMLPEQKLQYSDLATRYQHLKNLPVSDYRAGTPRILIGLKHLHVYAPLESRVGAPGEPIAVRTPLGWMVYGPQDAGESSSGFVGHHDMSPADREFHELLRSHFALEESGIAVTVLPESADDRRARDLLEKTTRRVGDRFVTGLLWKDVNPNLPDNYPMGVKRLMSLERKWSKNPQLRERVGVRIREYLEKGYAHKATAQDFADAVPGRVWYLPLNVVFNPKKPDKLRIVQDAAAAVNGVSLNTALLKGPDMLTDLPAVLFHFRERPVAFGGDIAEMYHQIRIQQSDKQAQRFLYRDHPSDRPEIFVMDVATFGSTCSPCSAQYIKNRNAKDFADEYPDAAAAILNKHYVDDYYDSTDTVEEAVKRAQEVRMIHSKGGFRIRNWVSNNAVFLEKLGEPLSNEVVNFSANKTTAVERVLGVSWDQANDVFVFSVKLRSDLEPFMSGIERPTKREVSSCVMSFFDPHGHLAPFTIHGKLIIQDLWRENCTWDVLISDEIASKWDRWIKVLPEVEALKIPRCYFSTATPQDRDSIQLHIFTDASETAYGCVAYFRIILDGLPRCALVAAKAKVAPLKYLSIPRLELLAAVLGARQVTWILANHDLPVSKVFLWTDSLTVLSWIISDHRKYVQFVASKLGEFRATPNIDEVRWVPTKLNIADVLTKWGAGPRLASNEQWINGPDFLRLPEDQWPQREKPAPNVKEELRAYHLFHEVVLPEPVIDHQRIARWPVMVRTVACLYRFASNCRRKQKGQPIEAVPVPEKSKILKLVREPVSAVIAPLTQAEHLKAERVLVKIAQQEGFGDELKTLTKNQDLPPEKWFPTERCSPLRRKTLLLDENGIIRLEGRTAYAELLPFDLKFPIVLPREHDITKKLLQSYHCRYGHANSETVVNEVRQHFYIQHLRATVKQVEKSCVWCKVRKSQPRQPKMAPLPDQRLTPGLRPFSFVGIDYFGPLSVTVGRRSEKRWVSLMTCLTTRAVHMEAVHSLSSQSCIMAIERFTSIRGTPLEFFSDNGTNFQAVSKEYGALGLKIDIACADKFTGARTRWNFNPPSAPHMGGSWERLVRSAKEAMKALDDGRRLTDEVLLTVLAKAAEMINSRPLTYIPQESSEVEALTPNHFLRGLPAGEHHQVEEGVDPAKALRDQYKRTQQLADILWQRWVKEYVPTIDQPTKWHADSKPIATGDLVYIADGSSRKSWVRGVIQQVIPGRDGVIRRAVVRLANGKELRRPVNKLAVLEIGGKSSHGSDPGLELRAGALLAPLATPATEAALQKSKARR